MPICFVNYPHPSALADAAGTDAWNIGLIGAEPARAEKIAFTAACARIDATYVVRASSPLTDIVDGECASLSLQGARMTLGSLKRS